MYLKILINTRQRIIQVLSLAVSGIVKAIANITAFS